MARSIDLLLGDATNNAQLDGGAVVGPRSKYNYIQGPAGLAIAVADNPGNDSVDVSFDGTALLAVKGRADAGPVSGVQPVVRLISGTDIAVSLVEAGGELQFTIASSGSGTFPGFGTGTPTADGGAGAQGVSTFATRFDHQHPESTAYTNRDGLEFALAAFSTTGNITLAFSGTSSTSASFRPRAAVLFQSSAAGDSFGFATGTATNQQIAFPPGAGTTFAGVIGSDDSAANTWLLTTFSTTQTIITHNTGANSSFGLSCCFGDNVP